MISRRSFIAGTSCALVFPSLAAEEVPMPSLFFGHGGPTLALDSERGAELREMAELLPRKPAGLIVFTPHVRSRHVTLATSGIARWSFPSRFRTRVGHLRYYPPNADDLGERVYGALQSIRMPFSRSQHKGFNHTVWMGLLHMFPNADVPVVEVAMPFKPSEQLFELGQALAPLRAEDVLIVSSGTITHNLGATERGGVPPSWAIEFDQWITEVVSSNSIDDVIDWRAKAPGAYVAHPDDGGHFNVLMFALGAAVGREAGLSGTRTMHADFEFGTLSKRGFILQ